MGGGNAEEKSKGAQSRLNFYSCFLKNSGSENAITPPMGRGKDTFNFQYLYNDYLWRFFNWIVTNIL